ncbi:hypothetical protein VTL71DRAFT_1823 [Oculimacula yallundae]|uniref:Uncharacterized protein n=1 Tax=Oculimacula yallundae TaxID=86028 RepID=A0ABR4CBT4_9HELO
MQPVKLGFPHYLKVHHPTPSGTHKRGPPATVQEEASLSRHDLTRAYLARPTPPAPRLPTYIFDQLNSTHFLISPSTTNSIFFFFPDWI